MCQRLQKVWRVNFRPGGQPNRKIPNLRADVPNFPGISGKLRRPAVSHQVSCHSWSHSYSVAPPSLFGPGMAERRSSGSFWATSWDIYVSLCPIGCHRWHPRCGNKSSSPVTTRGESEGVVIGECEAPARHVGVRGSVLEQVLRPDQHMVDVWRGAVAPGHEHFFHRGPHPVQV